MKRGVIVLIVIVVAVLIVAGLLIGSYNGLVSQKESVDNSSAILTPNCSDAPT